MAELAWQSGHDQASGAALSLALHGLFLAILLPSHPLQPPLPDDPIIIDVVDIAPQPSAPVSPQHTLPEPRSPPVPPPRPEPVPERSEAEAPPDFTLAAKPLSVGLLESPAGRKLRQQLARLAGDARLEQTCNLEALAQVAQAYPRMKPVKVVAYAFAPTLMAGATLIADGAALRNGKAWLRLSYRCTLMGARVSAFAFRLGAPVPQERWSDHGLGMVEDE